MALRTRLTPLDQALEGKAIASVRTEYEGVEITLDTGEILSFGMEVGMGGQYISISLDGQEIGRSD